MLRKDLKPGAVFRYSAGVNGGLWVVPPMHDAMPASFGGRMAYPSDHPDFNMEVEVVWEPPMLRKDLKPGAVFRYKMDDACPDVYTYYVQKKHPSTPDNWRKILHSAGCGTPEEQVHVLWEPPADSAPRAAPAPAHYTLTPEPIDAIEGWGLNYNLGSVVAYIARAGKKAGNSAKDDLAKARTFLSREIAAQEGRRAWE